MGDSIIPVPPSPPKMLVSTSKHKLTSFNKHRVFSPKQMKKVHSPSVQMFPRENANKLFDLRDKTVKTVLDKYMDNYYPSTKAGSFVGLIK